MKWICVLAVSAALAQQPAPPPLAPQPAPPTKPVPSSAAPAKTPAADPATTKTATANPAPATPAPKAEPAAQSATPTAAEAMRLSIEKQRASVAQQREVVRKQAESVGAWLKPGGPPRPLAFDSPLQADCEPLDDAVMAPLIETNAKAQQVKPELLRAVIEQESGYRPCAVSSKGAQGLMQLMPETSQELGVKDPFDPKENVSAGAKFLKQLVDKYTGDLAKALGAYNAGSGAVDQAGGVPPIPETQDYVDTILKKLGITPPAPPSIPTPKPIGN
jgi:soluble lytic murein transglycosylase-like protein